MNKIPKCQSKNYVSQINNIKVNQNVYFFKENLVPTITQKYIKLNSNRQFGKDITNSIKANINSIYNNNHHTKIKSFLVNKPTNNIYIKKHSSASQVAQKPEQLKITINDRILKEIGPNILEYYYNKNNLKKNDYPPFPVNPEAKLYNSISFGVNNAIRPSSSINNYNKYISMRLSNPNNNNIYNNLNNRSINIPNNNNNSSIESNNYNYKNEMTQSNLDLM